MHRPFIDDAIGRGIHDTRVDSEEGLVCLYGGRVEGVAERHGSKLGDLKNEKNVRVKGEIEQFNSATFLQTVM